MTLKEKVQHAASPLEALLLIATAVDELEARSSSEADPWAAWGSAPEDAVPELPASSEWLTDGEREGIETHIHLLKEQLRGNEDAEESKVLRAKIFLEEDKLVRPPDQVDLELARTVQVTDSTGDVTVDVPEATPEHEATRREFAIEQLKLKDAYGDENGELYAESYAKAGPLILYYTDREFVAGLPFDLKAAMVEDVEEFSPNEAAEMARDLLKDPDPGTPDIIVENS